LAAAWLVLELERARRARRGSNWIQRAMVSKVRPRVKRQRRHREVEEGETSCY